MKRQLVYVEDLVSELRNKRDNIFTKQDVIDTVHAITAKHGIDSLSLLCSNTNDSWDEEYYD